MGNHRGQWICANITYLLVIIIVQLCFSGNIQEVQVHYQQVIENWSADLIVDVLKSQNCSFNNQTHYAENVVNWDFQGTKEGCDCLHISLSERIWYDLEAKIYEGHCTHNMSLAYCEEIPPYPGKHLHKFHTQINELCAIRKRNTNYLHNKLNCFGQTCEYDLYSTEQPINAIQVSHRDPNCFQLNDHKYMCLQRGRLNPLVEFRVNEGHVCTQNRKQNLHKDRSNHPLAKPQREHCQQDETFIPIDQILESEFFRMNDIDDIQDRVVNYRLSHKHPYKIFSRGYIQWKCDDHILKDFIEVKDMQAFQLEFKTLQDTCLVGIIILLAISTYNNIKLIKVNDKDIALPLLRIVMYFVMMFNFKDYIRQLNRLNRMIGDYVDDYECFYEPTSTYISESNKYLMTVKAYVQIILLFTYGMIAVEAILTTAEVRREGGERVHLD